MGILIYFKIKNETFQLFRPLAGALAYDQVIIDENGMYAYVDSGERSSSPQFGPPQKGPRECNGVKVPNYKHGKYYCKPVKKNRSKGKKKKCVFKCDEGFKVQWKNKGKDAKKSKNGRIKCIPGEGWVTKPKTLSCVRK